MPFLLVALVVGLATYRAYWSAERRVTVTKGGSRWFR